MKVLLVTEKYNPDDTQRDGGARLAKTLKEVFNSSMDIMQFGGGTHPSLKWSFDYPNKSENRFERRIANASFIANQIQNVQDEYTHIIFIHISMEFNISEFLYQSHNIWTFPMFLTPSYVAGGEIVPKEYTDKECVALKRSKNIITPSYLEKSQLINFYAIPGEKIHVIPRGIDTQCVTSKIRSNTDTPKFCSIGSIKPQKNTIGLVRLFAEIYKKFPKAKLLIIGPVQNTDYYKEVLNEISSLGLNDCIEHLGYITPNKLPQAIADCHIHLSTSLCETFGRSIFETLAAGLPNIARFTGNAAANYLCDLPYVKFEDDVNKWIDLIEYYLANLPQLSSMAVEVGDLYNDKTLSKLLFAKITKQSCMAISDYDGTLFHKNDPEKTLKSIETFKQYSMRVICTARSLEDIMDQLKIYAFDVDWIIAYGGALIADGKGHIIFCEPINASLSIKEKSVKEVKVLDKVLQYQIPKKEAFNIQGFRIETYNETAYISNWKASKLHAVLKLLTHINWSGNIKVFGDGIYDQELVKYFDGLLITNSSIITAPATLPSIKGECQ